MDFLLSYRLFKTPKQITASTPSKYTDIYRTARISFLLLTVDSVIWEILQNLGIFFRFLLATYSFSFSDSKETLGYLDYINIALTVFYLLDYTFCIMYRFKYPNPRMPPQNLKSDFDLLVWRNAIYKPRSIFKLVFYGICFIPFEFIEYITPVEGIWRGVVFCLASMRVFRCFAFTWSSTENALLRRALLFQIFSKFTLMWFSLSHIYTCIYYLYVRNSSSTFLDLLEDKISFNKNNSFEWYLVLFYNTQFGFENIGTGVLTAATDIERLLAVFLTLTGYVLLNGYIISTLSNALSERNSEATTIRLRLSLMEKELVLRKIPKEKLYKLIEFYNSLWSLRKGIGSVDKMLNSLPNAFRSRVYCDLFMPALNASLLFRSCDEFSKRAVARIMETELYMAGDVILMRNQINSKMFYIRRGTIQIMSYQDDETQVMTFGAGSIFGQIALLMSIPAISEIHAATFCEVQVLHRNNLFRVISDYREAEEIIRNAHMNLLLNAMSDKYKPKEDQKPENLLTLKSFYKLPRGTTKIARKDICVVNKFPYIYEPDTVFMKMWEIFLVVIILIFTFYYPYLATYERKYPEKAEPFIVFSDLVLIFNIYLNFTTAILNDNILLSTYKEIFKYQLTKLSNFIDVVSVLPIHYFLRHDNRIKPIVLCIRCLEVYKVNKLFFQSEKSMRTQITEVLRLVRYVLYFLFIGYLVGIAYYLEACFTLPCIVDSWYMKNNISMDDSATWISLFAGVLLVSRTCYGDLLPKNIQDIVFIIGFCFSGVLLFICLIAEFSSNLALSKQPMQKFLHFSDRMLSFLVRQKISPNEINRVREFLNLQWDRNMGYEYIHNSNLFYDTPNYLLVEISMFSKKGGLQNIPLFKDFDENFLNILVTNLTRRIIPPHEVVIYAGEVCHRIIILEEGHCELTYGKDVSQKTIVKSGRDLCTIEFLLGITSLCHIRTLTHCSFLAITKSNLERALACSPFTAEELQKLVRSLRKNPILKEIQSADIIPLHLVVRSSAKKSLYRFSYFRKRGVNKELKEPYMKLGLCQWIRFFLGKATILPYGNLLKIWELSRCFFAFCSAMIFPLIPYFQLQVPVLYYIGIFLDIVAWIDLYFRMHVCYYNHKNLLVSHPLWTCCHYIKGSFFLDFLFCFPFDRIMYRPIYNAKDKSLVSSTPIDIIRSLRIFQIYRIPATVNNLGVDFLSPPTLFRVVIMEVAFCIVFINVLTSILILYGINYEKDVHNNYEILIYPKLREHFLQAQKKFGLSTEPFDIYIVNFYWVSETVYTTGFGDIIAETKELKIFVILVIVAAYLYFGYITVMIASYLSSINTNLTIYQKRMTHLTKFLKSENVEPLLGKHIINYFEYLWKKEKGMKAQNVFKNFSLALRDDVLLYLYEETLKNVGAFTLIDQSFIRIISSRVYETNFMSGAAIYKTKDVISELYIIHQGEVTLVGKNENENIILGPSEIFGHTSKRSKALAPNSAVATKNVTVLSIKTQDLYKLLLDFSAVTDKEKEKQKLQEALSVSNKLIHKNKPKTPRDQNVEIFAQYGYKHSKYILIFYLILSWFSVNEVSYNAAFQSLNLIFACILIPIELLFIFKIFLGFSTGYLNEAGELVSDRKSIRRRYMKFSGFYLDIFTAIPFEIFALVFHKKDQLYAVTLFRLTKYLRVHNIQYFFNLKFDTLSVNMVLLKTVAVFVWSVTLLHQCTCVWYFFSCPRTYCPESMTWNQTLSGDFHSIYLGSLYFVVTVLTTTGFGDITPHSVIEMIIVMLLLTFAFFQTAIVIGQLISSIHKYYLAKINYEFSIKGMKTYMMVNDVSSSAQEAVMRYVTNLWRNETGHQIPELFKDAPSYLIHEVKQSIYGHHINQNPIFTPCDPIFRRQLINELKRTVYFTGDIIVNEGEVDRTMYFVHTGLVMSTELANPTHEKKYYQGSLFGFKQGIKRTQPHSKTYRAMTFCIILSLEHNSWSFLSEFYPNDVKHIKEVALLEERI